MAFVRLQLRVSSEGRLEHFDVLLAEPASLVPVIARCLQENAERWTPGLRNGEPITEAWALTVVFQPGESTSVLRVPPPGGEHAARTRAPRAPPATREAVAATLRSANACVQRCDDPPRAYVLNLELGIGSEGRLIRARVRGGPATVNACAARCFRSLDYPVSDTDLEVPVTVHARQDPVAAAVLPPVPPPPTGFVRGRARFACPFTQQTDFTRLRGEARIRVTVSAEGRLVAYRVTRGTSPLRAFVRRCMEANRDRWEPPRDAASGAPVQATWDTRYRIEGEVWD